MHNLIQTLHAQGITILIIPIRKRKSTYLPTGRSRLTLTGTLVEKFVMPSLVLLSNRQVRRICTRLAPDMQRETSVKTAVLWNGLTRA